MKRIILTLSMPAALGLWAGAAAQQSSTPAPAPRPAPPPQGPEVDHEAEHSENAKRIEELFVDVERRLDSIDRLLSDAAAGERPLEAAADAGIERLLERTRADGDAVVRGIDEILRIPST